jgi:hypothetical protein
VREERQFPLKYFNPKNLTDYAFFHILVSLGMELIRQSLLATIESDDEKLLRLLHSIVLAHTNTYELEQWQKDELGRRPKSSAI